MTFSFLDLNRLLKNEPSLYENDFEAGRFEWIDSGDSEKCVISFLRKGRNIDDTLLSVCNFTPVVRYHYLIGVTESRFWKEVLNSDARKYGGSGEGSSGGVETITKHHQEWSASLALTLPPLGIIVLKRRKEST